METLQLKDNFYWTGILDHDLRVFDIIMYTEFGTTYNSYVLKTGGKTVLLETAIQSRTTQAVWRCCWSGILR